MNLCRSLEGRNVIVYNALWRKVHTTAKKNHKDNNTKRPEIIDCLQAFFSIINVNERDSKVRVYILYRVKNTIAWSLQLPTKKASFWKINYGGRKLFSWSRFFKDKTAKKLMIKKSITFGHCVLCILEICY